MLHALKRILPKCFNRVRGLFRYIYDYKILFASLLYIFLSSIYLKFLRNIGNSPTIGFFYLLFSLFFLFFSCYLLLRNISENIKKRVKCKNTFKLAVHFLGIGALFFFVSLIVFVRISPLVRNEVKILEIGESFTNAQVSFEGYIHTESDKRFKIQQLEVKQLEDIIVNDKILSRNHGYILLRTENFEKFSVGQVCKFTGLLVEPENFDDFDYKTYLKNSKIFFILENPNYYCFTVTQRRAGNFVKNFLNDFKTDLTSNVENFLQEPYSTILIGMLFGGKRRKEKEFEENVRIAGVSHIISASGYSVTILIVMIERLLFFLPKKIKTVLCLVLIWLFAIFSGFSNSIIRACIMNTLSLIALFFGRESRVHISLPLTCAIFVFLDPLIVLNVGFFLSISAILGLVYISPILLSIEVAVLKKIYRKIGRKYKVKRDFIQEYIFPTLSCTIGTLPIAILAFRTFSIWAIPVNAIILPAIESTMLWGVLSILFCKIHELLSRFLFLTISLQLKYFECIVEEVGKVNFGYWEMSEPWANAFSLSVFLIILFFVIYFYPIENEKYNYYLKSDG